MSFSQNSFDIPPSSPDAKSQAQASSISLNSDALDAPQSSSESLDDILSRLFDNPNLDPFAENNKTTIRTSAAAIEGDDDDFEIVARKLNAKSNDDNPLLLRKMLTGDNNIPDVSWEEDEEAPEQPQKTTRPRDALEDLPNVSDSVDKKIFSAQKQIKSELRQIRNIVRNHYKEMKESEKYTSPNGPLEESIKSERQRCVDYLLGAIAGIPKFHMQYEEFKENVILTPQLSQEYLDFKDIPYHKLVACMVVFLQSYHDLGLHYFTRFSALQVAFRNYLYEKIKPDSQHLAEAKQSYGTVLSVPIIHQDAATLAANPNVKHIVQFFSKPMPSANNNGKTDKEEHLNALERLYRALQNLINLLRFCPRPLYTPISPLSGSHTLFFRTDDSNLDHKHTTNEVKKLGF